MYSIQCKLNNGQRGGRTRPVVLVAVACLLAVCTCRVSVKTGVLKFMERKEAMEFIKQLISTKKVVVFSKTKCPYCVKAKEVLKFYNLPTEHYQVLELDGRSDMDVVQDALNEITGARTVPRIFINAKSIGGYTDLHKMHQSGELGRLLENLGLTE